MYGAISAAVALSNVWQLVPTGTARRTSSTHAPRWSVGEPVGDGPVRVTAEVDVPAEALAAIRAAGFDLVTVERYSEELGHANVIRVTPDGYDAASDARSDGSAIVV